MGKRVLRIDIKTDLEDEAQHLHHVETMYGHAGDITLKRVLAQFAALARRIGYNDLSIADELRCLYFTTNSKIYKQGK